MREVTPEVLSARQVRDYLGGVSQMFIHRRLADDPAFPKPFKLGAMTGKGQRRYWRRADIEGWLAKRASAA